MRDCNFHVVIDKSSVFVPETLEEFATEQTFP